MQKPSARNLNSRYGRNTKNGVQLDADGFFWVRVIFKSPAPVLFSKDNRLSVHRETPLAKKTFGLFGVIG